jgi:hypothetical protein
MTVRFSLQNAVCEEAASSFLIFAYFQMHLKRSFDEGRHWADISKKLSETASAEDPITRTRFMWFYTFVCFWFVPLRNSGNQLQEIHDLSCKCGDTELAYMSQVLRLKFLFFQGEQLSSVIDEAERCLQSVVSKISI